MNPATKEYLKFSIIISIIFSFIINFVFIELVPGTLIYGFPFSLNGAEGFGAFLFRILNTIIIAAFITFPVLYILRQIQRR